MKGIVFREFITMVETQFSLETAVVIIADSTVATGGAYTTDFLTWLVRDEGVVTLEEAHFRLSALAAHAAGRPASPMQSRTILTPTDQHQLQTIDGQHIGRFLI